MALKVNERSPDLHELVEDWEVLEPLMGGTRAMRRAAVKLLPKFGAEDEVSHITRIKTATLFPAYRRTVSVMSSKPFGKPLTLVDVPPEMEAWTEDVDLEGTNLHTFAAEMLLEGLAFGLAGILVEAPKAIESATGTPTIAEQKAAGVRPYLVRITHGQILGWKIDRSSGKAVLTQLRLSESGRTPDGPYGETITERVRVLTPGAFEVFEKQNSEATGQDNWVSIESGTTTLKEITFVPVYGARVAYMVGKPPLMEVADLNVKHWQSQSDQDTILHVARVPVLLATGFADTDTIAIGASSAVKTSNDKASLKWVEHSGEAIGAGKISLEDLEQQMIQAGAELLVKRPGARTATESFNDAEANKSDLQRITEGYESSLNQVLRMMADLGGLATSGAVTLYKDFGAANLSDASAQLILLLQQGGVISTETAIGELQRRGVLSDDIDPEDEAEKVAAQGPALGMMEDPMEPADPKPTPGAKPDDSQDA